METIPTYQHFTIHHHHDNRLTIYADCIKNDLERSSILKILLLKRTAIKEVVINVTTGLIDIHYQTRKMPEANLLQLLENVLKNLVQRSTLSIDNTVPEPITSDSSSKVINFDVEGMSCSSCSLYLQLMLKKEDGVQDASVDFPSATASVKTTLSNEDVHALVKKYGFQAIPIDEDNKHKDN